MKSVSGQFEYPLIFNLADEDIASGEYNDLVAVLRSRVNGKTINDWAFPICGSGKEAEDDEDGLRRCVTGEYTKADEIRNAIKDLACKVIYFKECLESPKSRKEWKQVSESLEKAIEYLERAKECLQKTTLYDMGDEVDSIRRDVEEYRLRNTFTTNGFRKAILFPLAFILYTLSIKISVLNFSILASNIIYDATDITVESDRIYESIRKIRRNRNTQDDIDFHDMMTMISPRSNQAP